MKKRTIAIAAAVALVVLAVPTIAFANGMQQIWGAAHASYPAIQQSSAQQAAQESAQRQEADGKAVSSILSSRGTAVQNGNGAGEGSDVATGACPGYVDADNDGVCDNCANGRSACPGYVDEDNDGVCDNFASGSCDGSLGHGCGNGQGDGSGCGRGYGHGGGHHGCARR